MTTRAPTACAARAYILPAARCLSATRPTLCRRFVSAERGPVRCAGGDTTLSDRARCRRVGLDSGRRAVYRRLAAWLEDRLPTAPGAKSKRRRTPSGDRPPRSRSSGGPRPECPAGRSQSAYTASNPEDMPLQQSTSMRSTAHLQSQLKRLWYENRQRSWRPSLSYRASWCRLQKCHRAQRASLFWVAHLCAMP